MGLVGQGRLLQGPLAHVLNAQGGGNDHDLVQAAFLPGLDEHARKTRIDGHARHGAAVFGQPVCRGVFPSGARTHDGPQFHQQVKPVADAFLRRPVDEGKIGNVPELEGDHAQDHLGQVGAQDFRLGEQGPVEIVLLRVETDADPVFHPPAAALALIGAASGNGHHRQGGGPGPGHVLGDARQPRVHHVADARNGDGRLGHVGGHDDLAGRGGGEDPALFRGAQPGKQGQDHGARIIAPPKGLAGLADVLLRGHEDQDVAPGLLLDQPVDGLGGQFDGGALILLFRFRIGKEIARFHREQPPGHLDHRRIVKRFGKFLRVDGGRGDDQLEIPSCAGPAA